jgi:hypothetical protein
VPWKTETAEKVKGALGEIPAYIRRVRNMEEAIRRLFHDAGKAREEHLDFVCLRFRKVLDCLSEEQGAQLPEPTLHALGVILSEVDELPAFLKLRIRPRDRGNIAALEKALDALRHSVDRFNDRWREWVEQEAPLAEANRKIDGYNRHYRIEKQCAVKYVPLDKIDFEPRAPLTTDDVYAELPLLPLP